MKIKPEEWDNYPNFKASMLAFAAAAGFKRLPKEFYEEYELRPRENFAAWEAALKKMNETGVIEWEVHDEIHTLAHYLPDLKEWLLKDKSTHPDIHDSNQG